jgi:hypothetical protein
VGWSLSAGSTIERFSPDNGVPTYTSRDIFVLDGQELRPCVPSVSDSPSCTNGGTHFTEVETYQKIRMVSTTEWEITDRVGTRYTYTGTYHSGLGFVHYYLSAVIDLLGNRVDYSYWCDPSADCYLDSILYGDVVVKFHREGRSDPITFANGNSLRTMRFRLKTIEVSRARSLVRACQISYLTQTGSS